MICKLSDEPQRKTMKKIYPVMLFLLLFSHSLSAQKRSSQCPLITVNRPGSLVRPGEIMTFSALIQGKAKTDFEYRWTIDKGVILEGQGTKMIHVSTEGLSDTVITATFEIQGLEKDCNNKNSEVGVVAQILSIDPVDSYGKISWEEESMKLDSLLITIQRNPGDKGYIKITTAKNESIINIKKHVGKLVKHIKSRGLSPGRFMFAIEKSEDHRTILMTVPEDAEIPKCENCEIIIGSDVN